MINRILAGLLAALAVICDAASVDVNRATQAELESVQGIGPALSETILDERGKRAFNDWQDLIGRVKGIGHSNAAKFSAQGLTVNGASYRGGAPAAKSDDPVKPSATGAATSKAPGSTGK